MGTPLAFLPILMMLGAAVGIAALLLVLNSFVGRKVRTRRKLMPYESGMPLLDSSRKRLSVKFFIVGLVFLLFDVEMAFLYPLALIRGYAQPFVYIEVGVFFAMLAATYIYLLKEGAFAWEN